MTTAAPQAPEPFADPAGLDSVGKINAARRATAKVAHTDVNEGNAELSDKFSKYNAALDAAKASLLAREALSSARNENSTSTVNVSNPAHQQGAASNGLAIYDPALATVNRTRADNENRSYDKASWAGFGANGFDGADFGRSFYDFGNVGQRPANDGYEAPKSSAHDEFIVIQIAIVARQSDVLAGIVNEVNSILASGGASTENVELGMAIIGSIYAYDPRTIASTLNNTLAASQTVLSKAETSKANATEISARTTAINSVLAVVAEQARRNQAVLPKLSGEINSPVLRQALSCHGLYAEKGRAPNLKPEDAPRMAA